MINGDLSDQYIDDTFDGLLHVNGQPIPSTGVSKVFDGVGNESALSVGRSGNGISINGSSSVNGSLSVSQNAVVVGQLTANNVTYPSSSISKSLLNIIYPVGAVYFSSTSISPASLFGGVWDRIAEGRFIVGAGTGTDSNELDKNFKVGETGGEYRHTLTTGQIPSHNHTGVGMGFGGGGENITGKWNKVKGRSIKEHQGLSHTSETITSENIGSLDNELLINDTGGDQSHNITPPGFGLYVYTRTA